MKFDDTSHRTYKTNIVKLRDWKFLVGCWLFKKNDLAHRGKDCFL